MSNINQCTDFLLRLAMMGKLTHDAGYFRTEKKFKGRKLPRKTRRKGDIVRRKTQTETT
jgi:hypothetical protein